ncbi:putative dimethyladenosine transferase 1, mitochondrial [Penaeus vannamei]|uniref:rRNA adenine N(6)-methyltransferase n=1 Tax=Penaeus vannamei TaxID=6689 RepID=A0A3R7PSM1_PENVA|nr:putative dimethyladenosine transferase 1, mitochondrial [Penaeus vannamei]
MMARSTTMAAKHFASVAMRLPPLPSTSDLVRLYKLRAIKQLSQNFLMDAKLTSKIVRSSGRVRHCHVCEDACGKRLDIQVGDVMTYNMEKLFPEDLAQPWDGQLPKIHLIGNLPFNIATPLIIRWLKDISFQQNAWRYGRVRMTLTFQREVAERMIALPETLKKGSWFAISTVPSR